MISALERGSVILRNANTPWELADRPLYTLAQISGECSTKSARSAAELLIDHALADLASEVAASDTN